VNLFFSVPDVNYFSVSTTSTIFGWLLLFLSGGTNELVLLCIPLAFLTALCGPLMGQSHLSDQFSTIFFIISTLF
jgi:hypothetical protein